MLGTQPIAPETYAACQEYLGEMKVYIYQHGRVLPFAPTHIFFLALQKIADYTYFLKSDLSEIEVFCMPPDKTGVTHEFSRPAYVFSRIIKLQGNIFTLARELEQYRVQNPYDLCKANCADEIEWFLEKYAGIPKAEPCSKPMSCNTVCLPVCTPSFFQPCTTPGRVMDRLRYLHDADPEHFSNLGRMM